MSLRKPKSQVVLIDLCNNTETDQSTQPEQNSSDQDINESGDANQEYTNIDLLQFQRILHKKTVSTSQGYPYLNEEAEELRLFTH